MFAPWNIMIARLRSSLPSNAVFAQKWKSHWGLIGANHGLKDCRNILMSRANQRLEILRLWTYAKSLDLVAWGKMRYNLLGQADIGFREKMPKPSMTKNFRPFSKKVLSGSEFPKFSAKRTRCFSRNRKPA